MQTVILCVCVCVWGERERERKRQRIFKKKNTKKGKKKDHAFFPFQTCSFPNVFKRLDASTNTNITFYGSNDGCQKYK